MAVKEKILFINGPNLNLLGKREPSIYGSQSFEEYFDRLSKRYSQISLRYFQSNTEGEILDTLHGFGFDHRGIVLNAGAFTHTSLAIADAIKAIDTPVVEVHISNIYAREKFRHHSYMAPHTKGIITGFGLLGYELALRSFLEETA